MTTKPAETTETTPTVQQLQIAVMKRTKNPLAPIILESLYNASEAGMELFCPLTEKETVFAIQQRLLKDFQDEELERLATDPALIASVLCILGVSLKRFPLSCYEHCHVLTHQTAVPQSGTPSDDGTVVQPPASGVG